jgi:hypothetical protein
MDKYNSNIDYKQEYLIGINVQMHEFLYSEYLLFSLKEILIYLESEAIDMTPRADIQVYDHDTFLYVSSVSFSYSFF